MIITIFLIVVAIGFLIGAAIYSRNKTRLTNLKSSNKRNFKKDRKTLLNLWGITKMNTNTIVANNATSIIIELNSINYDFLNTAEKNDIDISLTNIAKTIKFPIQFISTKRKLNIDERIEEIRENSQMTNNPRIKKYAEIIAEHIENIKEDSELYVEKDYMVITSYEQTKKAEKDLKYFYENFKDNLMELNIESHILDNLEILELLQRELNKADEQIIEKVLQKGGLDLYVVSQKRQENKYKYK